MTRVDFLEAAETDLSATVAYYNLSQEDLGYEFLDEFKRALIRIIDFPEAWPLISKRTRRCHINRFPYGIIYKANANILLVIAVMHLHSEPEKWKKRQK
jgi:hypothetical protein